MKFRVRDEKAESALRNIGQIIKRKTPDGMGFALLLFDYGNGGNMFYISSAQRQDMLNAMREFIQTEEKE